MAISPEACICTGGPPPEGVTHSIACTAKHAWKPGFRHCMKSFGAGWRCVDCDQEFKAWPSDDQPCPGPKGVPMSRSDTGVVKQRSAWSYCNPCEWVSQTFGGLNCEALAATVLADHEATEEHREVVGRVSPDA